MPAIIDVLTVIDVDSILELYGSNISTDRSKPTILPGPNGDPLIHMIAKYNSKLQHQGEGGLVIPVEVNDVIRWRATDIAKNLGNAVILDKFKSFPVNAKPIVNTPRLVKVTDNISSLDPNNPNGPPTQQVITTNAWEATAEAPGTLTYTWSFIIVNRRNSIIGCCQWDPQLVIS